MSRVLPRGQVEAERLRRARETFEAAEPTPEELRLSFRRQWFSAPKRRRFLPQVAIGALVGSLSCGAALAWGIETGVVAWRSSDIPSSPPETPPRAPPPSRSGLAVSAGGTASRPSPIPATPDVDSHADQDDADSSPDGAPESTFLEAPSPPPVNTNAHFDRLPTTLADRPTSEPSAPLPSRNRGAPDRSAWQSVAAALRDGDTNTANQALAPLLEDADPEVSDAARLVRAQLAVRQGRGASVRNELMQLERSGASASIRQSARQLLVEITDSSTTHENEL